MKIKLLLAGNNASRHAFLKSLGQHVTFSQAGASVNMLGTGTYCFKLAGNDIEILYIEDCKDLQKNYDRYAVRANAIIFVDADEETQKLLRAACPKGTAVTKHRPGTEINGLAGVESAIKAYNEKRQKKLIATNPHTQFVQKSTPAQQPVPSSSQNDDRMELLKKFLAERTPVRK